MQTCSDILKDFESGPLDIYRKNSTIDWKKMKVFIESEDILRYKVINKYLVKLLCVQLQIFFLDESLENI